MICPHCGGDTDVEPLPKLPLTRPEHLAELQRLLKEAEDKRNEHIRRIYPLRPPWNVGDIL